MLNPVKVSLNLSMSNEYLDDVPDMIIMTLEEKQIKRIIELSEEVKRLKVTHIADSDYPDFFMNSYSYSEEENEVPVEWEGSTEINNLIITDDSFYWEGYIKDTECRYSSESYFIDELKARSFTFEDLPLLIDLVYSSAKDILKERLEKGE